MLSLLLLFSLFFLVGFSLISYLHIGCRKRCQIWNLPNLIISGWVKFVSFENFSVLMKIFVCYLQWLQHYWTERTMYPKKMFLPTEWILKQVHQLLQNGGVQSMALSEVVSLVLNSMMVTAASMKILLTEQQTTPHWMHVLHSVNRIKKACTNLFRSKNLTQYSPNGVSLFENCFVLWRQITHQLAYTFLVQDKATAGKRGLGIGDCTRKLGGAHFKGQKTIFGDDGESDGNEAQKDQESSLDQSTDSENLQAGSEDKICRKKQKRGDGIKKGGVTQEGGSKVKLKDLIAHFLSEVWFILNSCFISAMLLKGVLFQSVIQQVSLA